MVKVVLLGISGAVGAILVGAVFSGLSGYLFLKTWEYLSPLPDDANGGEAFGRVGTAAMAMGAAFLVGFLAAIVGMAWFTRDKSPRP